jgi:hypothetical protein
MPRAAQGVNFAQGVGQKVWLAVVGSSTCAAAHTQNREKHHGRTEEILHWLSPEVFPFSSAEELYFLRYFYPTKAVVYE